MKILINAGLTSSLVIFRGPLIAEMVKNGHVIMTTGAENEEETIRWLSQQGVGFRQVRLFRTGINPVHDLVYLLDISKVIKEFKPDIIFGYTHKPVLYGAIASGKNVKVCSFITGLGYSFSEGNNSLKRKIVFGIVCLLYRIALRRNYIVFFQNKDDKEIFEKYKLTSNKIKTVIVNGSGVDLTKYSYIEPQIDTIKFLLVARMLKEKGIIEYVEAARCIKRKYPEVRFELVGPCDPSPDSISADVLEKWKNSNVVTIHNGFLDVKPFLERCNVYVLPSYREGTPRTVLEAMATGRAIITTNTNGCRETIVLTETGKKQKQNGENLIEGENGFLVSVKNVDALVKAMDRFILNPELLVPMGIRSRQIACGKYDVHSVNEVMMKEMLLIKKE